MVPPRRGGVRRTRRQLVVQVEALDCGEHLADLVLALLKGNLQEVGDGVPRRRDLDEDRGCLPDDHLVVLQTAPIALNDIEDVLPDLRGDSEAANP